MLPISNAKGDDAVVDVVVAVFWVEAWDVIAFCYVVSGAIAECPVKIWSNKMMRMHKLVCEVCIMSFF